MSASSPSKESIRFIKSAHGRIGQIVNKLEKISSVKTPKKAIMIIESINNLSRLLKTLPNADLSEKVSELSNKFIRIITNNPNLLTPDVMEQITIITLRKSDELRDQLRKQTEEFRLMAMSSNQMTGI